MGGDQSSWCLALTPPQTLHPVGSGHKPLSNEYPRAGDCSFSDTCSILPVPFPIGKLKVSMQGDAGCQVGKRWTWCLLLVYNSLVRYKCILCWKRTIMIHFLQRGWISLYWFYSICCSSWICGVTSLIFSGQLLASFLPVLFSFTSVWPQWGTLMRNRSGFFHSHPLFWFSTAWSFSAVFLVTSSTLFLFANSLLGSSYSVLSIYLYI